MQRLFSTFANGWPGRGLLVLRLLTSVVLLRFGIACLLEGPPLQIAAPQILGIVSAAFITVGLWTPVTCALACLVNVWIALARFPSHSCDPWIAVIHAALCAALGMIGPGAWSFDARLFGRKHIELRDDL